MSDRPIPQTSTVPPSTAPRGHLIVFEGGDGSGKTTQAKRLANDLASAGMDVVHTRDPGGSPNAMAIRGLLVDAGAPDWSPMGELLLFTAARVELLEETIKPALAAGKIVVCDRFVDSTLGYQGAGKGNNTEIIRRLHRLACENLVPDLTVLMDGPAEVLLARATGRLASDGSIEGRFEQEGLGFQERVVRRLRDLARMEPARYAVIDATLDPDSAARQVADAVANRLGLSATATLESETA